jgi:SAM-dependent methyltransferase
MFTCPGRKAPVILANQDVVNVCKGHVNAQKPDLNVKSNLDIAKRHMDYQKDFSENRSDAFILLKAEPQIGKTGTFIYLIEQILGNRGVVKQKMDPWKDSYLQMLTKGAMHYSREGVVPFHNFWEEKIFSDYHRTYNEVKKKWSEDHLDFLCDALKDRIYLARYIVDFGCGDGRLEEKLIEDGIINEDTKLIAIDMHRLPEFIERERKYPQIIFKKMNFLDYDNLTAELLMGNNSGKIDCILFSLSLFIDNVTLLFDKAWNLLRKGMFLGIIETSKRIPESFERSMKENGFVLATKTEIPPKEKMFYLYLFSKSDRAEKDPKKHIEGITLKEYH